MLRRFSVFLAFCIALAGSFSVTAAVLDVASNGFTVQETAQVAAPRNKVYAALLVPAHWWNSDHTFSGDASQLRLDAKAGGCWCEKLPNGGSVMHMTVVYVDPGRTLRLRGALGPFQGHGVDGSMTWTLKAEGNGTALSLAYALGGYNKDGFDQWSKAADGVLTEQIARLKRYVETGVAYKH